MAKSMANQKRAIEEGFTLLRLALKEKKIKWAMRAGCWQTYHQYQTQTQCQEAWKSLMSSNMNIEA